MNNLMWFLGAFFTFWSVYAAEQIFWYRIEQKYCNKFKGHCELCDCWSCKRKEFIDQYKGIIRDSYKNYGG